MFVLALALAAPTPLTAMHQHAIFCVVEIAIMANQQERGAPHVTDFAANGKRWAGLVGARIVQETGQPRELVAFAMMAAAKDRAGRITITDKSSCTRQMKAELATADAINAALPKPAKAK